MNNKLDTKKFIFIFSGIFLLGAIIIIVYLKKKFPDLLFKDYFWKVSYWAMLILLIAIILYWILWKLMNQTKRSEVDTVIAEKIMIEKIAEKYRIPLYAKDNKGFRKLINPKNIKFHNCLKFYQPHTSIPFYMMDIEIFSEDYAGRDMWQVQLDMGEDYIRNNFQSWFMRHVSLNTVDIMRKTFPSATPQKQTEQILNAISEKREEGEDTTGMEQLLSKSTDEEPDAPQGSGYTPPPQMNQGMEQQDVSKQMADEYEQDIQKYRENNK